MRDPFCLPQNAAVAGAAIADKSEFPGGICRTVDKSFLLRPFDDPQGLLLADQLAHFSIGHEDRSLAEGQAITMRNAAMVLFVKQELIRTLFSVG